MKWVHTNLANTQHENNMMPYQGWHDTDSLLCIHWEIPVQPTKAQDMPKLIFYSFFYIKIKVRVFEAFLADQIIVKDLFDHKIKCTDTFLLKNYEELWTAKVQHIIFLEQKWQCFWKCNLMLTNKILNSEQPSPAASRISSMDSLQMQLSS